MKRRQVLGLLLPLIPTLNLTKDLKSKQTKEVRKNTLLKKSGTINSTSQEESVNHK